MWCGYVEASCNGNLGDAVYSSTLSVNSKQFTKASAGTFLRRTPFLLSRLLNEPRLRRDVLRLDDHNLSSNHEEASNQIQVNSKSLKVAKLLLI
jgi:hypothetical protein